MTHILEYFAFLDYFPQHTTRLHPQGRWPEVPILIGTAKSANTALLPLKVPNSGSGQEKLKNVQKVIIFWIRKYSFTTSESSKFWFQYWFRRLSTKSFWRRWRDKIGANVHSPLIYAGQTHMSSGSRSCILFIFQVEIFDHMQVFFRRVPNPQFEVQN